jgi:hypothetical protein
MVACAQQQPEPEAEALPELSAERLGDADTPDEVVPDDQRYLTPAEREALAAQGYEPAIDDRMTTQTRVQPPRGEPGKTKTERTMDHMGRGFVAFASVAMVVGAAVAPFFLF